jgi:tRNA (guanine9-N1)-methyltransferase
MSKSPVETEPDPNSTDMPENTENLVNTTSNDPPLSKNALKRQLKRQRWEDGKEERRAYKKAKLKQKKEDMKANGQLLPKRNKATVEGQEDSGFKVVIDCGFDELMSDKVLVIALAKLMSGNH